MKIMVLNDGTTYSDICGCQIVEVDNNLSDDDIEDCLKTLNHQYDDCDNAKIFGGFDADGVFHVGDPRTIGDKKTIKLE